MECLIINFAFLALQVIAVHNYYTYKETRSESRALSKFKMRHIRPSVETGYKLNVTLDSILI